MRMPERRQIALPAFAAVVAREIGRLLERLRKDSEISSVLILLGRGRLVELGGVHVVRRVQGRGRLSECDYPFICWHAGKKGGYDISNNSVS